MASMIPYDRYARGLRTWPFDAIDNFFDAPLASLATDAGFKMNVEDAGDKYVVTAELPADLWTMSGKLVVAVERTLTGTRVQAATAIGGQYFDWGKSTRCLDGLFGDLKKRAA